MNNKESLNHKGTFIPSQIENNYQNFCIYDINKRELGQY